jgi:hypothetical protein
VSRVFLLADVWFRRVLRIGVLRWRIAGALLALLTVPLGLKYTLEQMLALAVVLGLVLVAEKKQRSNSLTHANRLSSFCKQLGNFPICRSGNAQTRTLLTTSIFALVLLPAVPRKRLRADGRLHLDQQRLVVSGQVRRDQPDLKRRFRAGRWISTCQPASPWAASTTARRPSPVRMSRS